MQKGTFSVRIRPVSVQKIPKRGKNALHFAGFRYLGIRYGCRVWVLGGKEAWRNRSWDRPARTIDFALDYSWWRDDLLKIRGEDMTTLAQHLSILCSIEK